ncbi:hypothetical protein ACPPVV_01180 [Rhodanobacter sp. Col0626]|uniref:hypothetical protein n=1 Tax=Rhodanobacter sp. Col0626 TaxID=3415679 RepID=UPI003CEC2106
MSNDTIQNNISVSKLSLKLASLQPKARTANQAKIAEHYDDIVNAIERGVSMKALRAALAEDGVAIASATFKKLLENERKRREAGNDEAGLANGGDL